MSVKGVVINRGLIGPSINSAADTISALLVNGPAVTQDLPVIGIAVGEAVKITSRLDANSLGINEAYDTANNVRVWRHIDEFYRIAGEGTELWIMLYAGLPSAAFGDTYAKKLIASAKGTIRQLAIAYNPAVDYAASYVDGLEEVILDSIPAAQTFYEWTYETFRPCQVLIEGRGFNAVSSTAALNLRAIEVSGVVVDYYKVSLCIGQDWTYAETQNAVGKKMADVGTLLGSVAKMPVNRNIGEVESMNLTDAARGKYLVAGLSNHTKTTDFESHLEGLDAKGYIFTVSYSQEDGLAGEYWNDDHVCAPVKVDDDGNMNESSISYGRVHDKAVRVLRNALLPKVKSTQPVDSSTGKLPTGVVKYFEGIGNDAFSSKMKGEISAGVTTVDANSNLLIAPKELKASFVVVPTGQIGKITGTINLKTSV